MNGAAKTGILGIDFSGAAQAGRRLWICSGRVVRERLIIESCRRGADLPGSGAAREKCLAVLRRFLAAAPENIAGMDFPFSLHRGMIAEENWDDFAKNFAGRYPREDDFRAFCRGFSAHPELKRTTDIESRAPFSPYNLRVYRQTYYGIRDVLAPLAASGAACVLPMQRPLPDRIWIVETCPASLLKRLDLYRPYKGAAWAARVQRRRILTFLLDEGTIRLKHPALKKVLLDDAPGDALDSFLAACSTFRMQRQPGFPAIPATSPYSLEGRVYY